MIIYKGQLLRLLEGLPKEVLEVIKAKLESTEGEQEQAKEVVPLRLPPKPGRLLRFRKTGTSS